MRNTSVPKLKTLDASYIKTPFHEESLDKPGADFGLIIATDGYDMRNGLCELWNMVIQENIKTITSFNETFLEDGKWFGVYKYFPEKLDAELEVADVFVVKAVKVTSDKCQVSRVLDVLDAKTGKKLHQVKHIHFKVWEDFEVPTKENTAALMACLQPQVTMLME